MENKSHAFIAGIFTVILTVAVMVAASWLNRDTTLRTPYVLTTSGSIAGLNVQAAVKYRGMEVARSRRLSSIKTSRGKSWSRWVCCRIRR